MILKYQQLYCTITLLVHHHVVTACVSFYVSLFTSLRTDTKIHLLFIRLHELMSAMYYAIAVTSTLSKKTHSANSNVAKRKAIILR